MFAAVAVAVAAAAVSAAPVIDPASARLLSSVIASAAASDTRVDVISSEDVRRAADVDANRQMLGCDPTATSCLAEIAAAMGASVVLHGSVGPLGDELVLSLNMFDGRTSTSIGRTLLRAKSVDDLSHQVEPAAKMLVAQAAERAATAAPAVKQKVLVIDLAVEQQGGTEDAPAKRAQPKDAGPPLPWLLVSAGVAGVAGVVGVVVGAVFDGAAVAAHDKAAAAGPGLGQTEAEKLRQDVNDDSLYAGAFYLGGGALVVVAGALAVAHFVGE